jgi:teichuronic acid biosynthesis glycosyltransferase TuaC
MKSERSILLLTHLFPNPADPKLGTFFRNKAVALKQAGCRITVVSPVPFVPFPLGLLPCYRDRIVPVHSRESEGIEIHYPRFFRPPGAWFRPFEGLSMYLASRALIRRLHRSARFDAVIGGMLTNDGYASVLTGSDLGIPAYSYAIGSDIHTFPKNEPRVARLTRRLFSELDGVFAVGPNFTRQIHEEYPEHNEKVRSNPLGVDTSVFCPGSSKEWWRELGFAEDLTVGLFVGDLTHAKGIADWMGLVPQLSDLRVGWVLIGKGELLGALERMIAGGAPGFEHVRVFPYVDFASLIRSYQMADFFFFPSHVEGSPTVLIEAIACGLPVIASDIPANHDAVTEGVNGRFFPVGELARFELSLRKFLVSNDIRAFAVASREKALNEFDSAMNARFLLREISALPHRKL